MTNTHKSIIFTFFAACFLSCSSEPSNVGRPNHKKAAADRNKDTILTNSQIKRKTIIPSVDLDSLKSTPVKTYRSNEHKTLTKKGEKDTLKMNAILKSVLIADYEYKAKDDYDADLVLSRLLLKENSSVLFSKDSVFSATAYELDNERNILSFATILKQNNDSFETTSDLYFIDLNTRSVTCLKKTVINTVNAPFSLDHNSFYYLDDGIIYSFNLKTAKTAAILQFANPSYLILTIKPVADKVLMLCL